MLKKLIYGTTALFKEICMDNLTLYVNDLEYRQGVNRTMKPFMLLIGGLLFGISVLLFFYLFSTWR